MAVRQLPPHGARGQQPWRRRGAPFRRGVQVEEFVALLDAAMDVALPELAALLDAAMDVALPELAACATRSREPPPPGPCASDGCWGLADNARRGLWTVALALRRAANGAPWLQDEAGGALDCWSR
ncbi:hypothetical protein ZWY2020_009855 [Hordeum vulgare]|nr:hypothetical protein ZWY2020_009855 [Hordeum vulgare]